MAEHEHIWKRMFNGAQCTVKDCRAILYPPDILKRLNELEAPESSLADSEKREAGLWELAKKADALINDNYPTGLPAFPDISQPFQLLIEFKDEVDKLVNKYGGDGQAYQGPQYWEDRIASMERSLADSQKRESDLRDIVKAGLVMTEGIGTEIGTNPLPDNDPDSTWEDTLMTLALEFKVAALEALKEAKT